jgi:hypothetical protein
MNPEGFGAAPPAFSRSGHPRARTNSLMKSHLMWISAFRDFYQPTDPKTSSDPRLSDGLLVFEQLQPNPLRPKKLDASL